MAETEMADVQDHADESDDAGADDETSTALKGDSASEESPFPEGGYGWIVVVACFFTQMIAVPLPLYYGAFFLAFSDYFQESKMRTALVGSVCYGLFVGTGPLVGVVCRLIGHRKACFVGTIVVAAGYLITAFATNLKLIYFSYGVLVGLGFSVTSIVSMVLPSLYFKKRRSLANGIAMTGAGIGFLTVPLLEQYLIDRYTWRGAAIVLAGISLHLCVCGAFMRPNPKLTSGKKNGQTISESLISDVQVLKELKFILAILASTAEGVFFSIYFSILTDRVVNYGYTPTEAAMFMTMAGISSTVARLASGIIGNFARVNYIVVYGVNMFFISLAPAVLVLDRPQYGVLVTVFVVNGANIGIRGAFMGAYIVQMVGVGRATAGVGYLVTGESVGVFVGPTVAGYIYDVTGSYKIAFIAAFGLCFFASLLIIPVYFLHKRSRKSKHHTIS